MIINTLKYSFFSLTMTFAFKAEANSSLSLDTYEELGLLSFPLFWPHILLFIATFGFVLRLFWIDKNKKL